MRYRSQGYCVGKGEGQVEFRSHSLGLAFNRPRCSLWREEKGAVLPAKFDHDRDPVPQSTRGTTSPPMVVLKAVRLKLGSTSTPYRERLLDLRWIPCEREPGCRPLP